MIGKIYNVIMNKLLVTMIVLLLIGGCSTNWNFENTGLAKEHFDGNMYEYLKSDSYNWDSIRLIGDGLAVRLYVDMADAVLPFCYSACCKPYSQKYSELSLDESDRSYSGAVCGAFIQIFNMEKPRH